MSVPKRISLLSSRPVQIGLAGIIIIGMLVAVLVVRGKTPKVRRTSGPPGPVLLVPGYGGDTSDLLTLEQALKAQGRSTILVEYTGDGTGDLRDQAKKLDQAVTQALQNKPQSQTVDVVGYSAGGIIARYWADKMGGAIKLRAAVTLGSPHNGTNLAGLGAVLFPQLCPLGCQQLTPNSEFLRELPELTPGPTWTSIWTTNDEVVTPPESAKLDQALSINLQQICPDSDIKHGGLPKDPQAIGITLRALGQIPLDTVPPASECGQLRTEGTAANPL